MEIRSYYTEERAMPKIVSDSRKIEGYAVVFEVESRVLYDKRKTEFFIEVIKRGAITMEMLNKMDIKAVTEHKLDRLLARRFKGKGSLELSIDDYGVKYTFEAPNTVEGDTVIEHIKRGDIFGSSFSYWTDDKKNVTYKKTTDGTNLREVNKIDMMFDVSVVLDPAYWVTEVNLRSFDNTVVEEETAKENEYEKEIEELKSLID